MPIANVAALIRPVSRGIDSAEEITNFSSRARQRRAQSAASQPRLRVLDLRIPRGWFEESAAPLKLSKGVIFVPHKPEVVRFLPACPSKRARDRSRIRYIAGDRL